MRTNCCAYRLRTARRRPPRVVVDYGDTRPTRHVGAFAHRLSDANLTLPGVTDADPELAATLDAEYRAFVRSLHAETIATVTRVDDWWHHEAFRNHRLR